MSYCITKAVSVSSDPFAHVKRACPFLIALALGVFASVCSRAESVENAVYADLARPTLTWTPIGVPFVPKSYGKDAVYGIDLAPLVSDRKRMIGLQVGGLGARSQGEAVGVQIGAVGAFGGDFAGVSLGGLAIDAKSLSALAFSACDITSRGDASGVLLSGGDLTVKRDAAGIFVAGLWQNLCRDGTGLQFSGLSSSISRDACGLQLSVLGNEVRRNMFGVQIAALGNRVHGRFNGLQIALANEAADGTFLQIGLINFGIVRKDGKDESSFFPILRFHY